LKSFLQSHLPSISSFRGRFSLFDHFSIELIVKKYENNKPAQKQKGKLALEFLQKAEKVSLE
jgi:hypothetical protein